MPFHNSITATLGVHFLYVAGLAFKEAQEKTETVCTCDGGEEDAH